MTVAEWLTIWSAPLFRLNTSKSHQGYKKIDILQIQFYLYKLKTIVSEC